MSEHVTEQVHEPDHVADKQARRGAEERQAVADGAAESTLGDDDATDESGYTTEGEQGAAQPSPSTSPDEV